jgi:glycosyltransferase involved in cell wall biosynthesis
VILGFVGFIRAWHGLDALLLAMAQHGDERVKLLIAGSGPERSNLERQIRELGLSARVNFSGLVQREQVPLLLSEIDIAVQPKVVCYASPLKIFEYMAAGCAIVAPDQPNIREVLRNGATALLFDPGQENAMWRAILRLVEDASLRHRLGEAARAEVVRLNYTWQGNAKQLLDWARADLSELS